MTTLVVDATVVVAALSDDSDAGRWSAARLVDHDLVAPHLLLVEASNTFRRLELSGELTSARASDANADLVHLRLQLFAYAPLAERVWELRHTVSAYDAWYVALAESLDAPLATLDLRLVRAPGPRCAFVGPDRP